MKEEKKVYHPLKMTFSIAKKIIEIFFFISSSMTFNFISISHFFFVAYSRVFSMTSNSISDSQYSFTNKLIISIENIYIYIFVQKNEEIVTQ